MTVGNSAKSFHLTEHEYLDENSPGLWPTGVLEKLYNKLISLSKNFKNWFLYFKRRGGQFLPASRIE
jgi:hypothetical protein